MCCRRNSLKADMMMTMVSAAAPSPISAYRRGGAWWRGVAAFLVPSFFLRTIRPSASEGGKEGSERHANVFRGARDYAAFLAAGAKRSRQRQRAGERASEDLAWPTNLSTANINMINLIQSSARLELSLHKRHCDV